MKRIAITFGLLLAASAHAQGIGGSPLNGGGGGGGATIPATTSVLKGDGSGNGAAAIPGTDYVIPSGTVANATNARTSPGTFVAGDSIACSTGATSALVNGWAYLLRNYVGGPVNDNCRPGDMLLDSVYNYIAGMVSPNLTPSNQVNILEVGTNDVTTYGSTANLQNTFQRLATYAVYHRAIPDGTALKHAPAQSLTGWTFSGSYATDSTQGSIIPDYTTTTAGNTATYSFTCAAACVKILAYPINNGTSGTFSVQVDGSTITDPISGSGTTFYSAGDGGATITTTNGTSKGKAALRLSFSAGAHTIRQTVLTAAASNTVGVNYVADVVPTTGNPVTAWVSPNHQNNANDALSGTYAGYIQTIAGQAATDGLSVAYADTRNAAQQNTVVNLYVAAPSTSYTQNTTVSVSSISYASTGVAFTQVGAAPAVGQFSLSGTTYSFNSLDANTPIIIRYTANCGATLTNVYANCYIDTLHPNDAYHAIMAATVANALPATSLTGSNLAQFTAPIRTLANGVLPSQMWSPNGQNLAAQPTQGFLPGVLWTTNVNQAFFTTKTALGGITNVGPNFGSGCIFSIANYGAAGLPHPSNESQLSQLLCASGNGALTSNFTSLTHNGTLNLVNSQGGSPFAASFQHNAVRTGVNQTVVMKNIFTTGVTAAGFIGTARTYETGVGNGSEATLGVANKFYLYDQTGAKLIYSYDPTTSIFTFATPLAASQLITTPETVTFSATPTFSAVIGTTRLVLTGNVTFSTLAAGMDGAQKTFQLCQDATGSRTFTWPATVKGGMTISPSASTCSLQTFTYSTASGYAFWYANSLGVAGL